MPLDVKPNSMHKRYLWNRDQIKRNKAFEKRKPLVSSYDKMKDPGKQSKKGISPEYKEKLKENRRAQNSRKATILLVAALVTIILLFFFVDFLTEVIFNR